MKEKTKKKMKQKEDETNMPWFGCVLHRFLFLAMVTEWVPELDVTGKNNKVWDSKQKMNFLMRMELDFILTIINCVSLIRKSIQTTVGQNMVEIMLKRFNVRCFWVVQIDFLNHKKVSCIMSIPTGNLEWGDSRTSIVAQEVKLPLATLESHMGTSSVQLPVNAPVKAAEDTWET